MEHNATRSLPRVLTILPHKERFSPQEAGAISLLVQRMALPGEYVVGHEPSHNIFPDIPFIPTPKTFSLLGERSRYSRAIRRVIHQTRPQLVEIHNAPFIAFDLCRTYPNLPIILVFHNDPCAMRSLRTPSQRETLARRVTIVTVSEWLRERFLSQNVQAHVTVIPNSLDFSEIPSPAKTRDPILLYVGRIVADKGVDTFVAACNRLLPHYPQWQGIMIGTNGFGVHLQTSTPFLQNLLPKAQAAGIQIRGFQPHASVLQSMSKAAIVVVPSRWEEPFGMVALEAMACGAALITTRCGNLPSVAGETALYVDNPDDPTELATHIEHLINDHTLLKHYAQAGLKRARLFDSHTMRLQRQHLHKEIIQNTATTL